MLRDSMARAVNRVVRDASLRGPSMMTYTAVGCVPSIGLGGASRNAGGTKNGIVAAPSTCASSWGAPSPRTRTTTGGIHPGPLAGATTTARKHALELGAPL